MCKVPIVIVCRLWFSNRLQLQCVQRQNNHLQTTALIYQMKDLKSGSDSSVLKPINNSMIDVAMGSHQADRRLIKSERIDNIIKM